jgi:hypothetical protein
LKEGTKSAAKMAIVAITISNSMSVNAVLTGRGERLAMDIGGLVAHHIAHRREVKAKKSRNSEIA